MAAFSGLVLAISWAFSPQGAPADPAREALLERFSALAEAEQEALVERVYRAVLRAEHPLAAAALRLEQAAAEAAAAEPDRHFDPERYAPALGLKTRVLRPSEAAWKKVQKQYFGKTPLPLRDAAWGYEFGRNRLLRPTTVPAPAARLAALYDGRWPEPSRLAALAEAALDHDAGLDSACDYFEHAYRDRDGRVYAGMRLYDLWNSGRELEISDVEAVAWLQTVASEHQVRSPIPKQQHGPIYARIRDSFQQVRQYQTLRQALAARHLDPNAAVPALFQGQESFLDQVWALYDHDPAALRRELERVADRDQVLAELSARLADPPGGAAAQQARLQARAELAPALAAAARAALKDEGLLGLGRR